MVKRKRGSKGAYGRRKKRNELLRLACILFLAALLSLWTNPGLIGQVKQEAGQILGKAEEYFGKKAPADTGDGQPENGPNEEGSRGVTVHYLDVEKCNCVLVQTLDGHCMLIDAGSNDDAHTDQIVSYLQAQGVEQLDYLLITHPHKDHIRAVPQILDEFEVNEVLMGEFALETVGTKTYQRVMEALEAKDPLITRPEAGETYLLGNASFTILINDDSAETAAEGLNDCSIGLILTDGYHRFLFYGDGEEAMEERLRESGYDLSCDVMMVAHHGSKTSTKRKTLQAVQPQIAVISCGIDGDGKKQEPSDKVLQRLQEYETEIYRTDLNGTIVIESRENGLFVNTEK